MKDESADDRAGASGSIETPTKLKPNVDD